MDPIGTIRRETHDAGHSIWVRMDPGYPDNQLVDTEWTCIWSTAPGNIAERLGSPIIEQDKNPIIGQVRDTPAYTGVDVEIGDKVAIRSAGDEDPVVAEVWKISEVASCRPRRYFTLWLKNTKGEVVSLSNYLRSDFDLVEED